MLFRTEYKAEPRQPLDPERPILLMGSCFTSEIGERMRACAWDADLNPCGTLFNPLSISSIIRMALRNETPKLVCKGGRWLSFALPTRFSSENEHEAASLCREAVASLRRSLLSAQAIIATFGTSIIYEETERGQAVANCHKLPASLFRKRRLTVEEIAADWRSLADEIHAVNPEMRILLTVSPVRHLKDGFEGNARQKSILLLACERLCDEGVAEYFPAYEIVNDDLRDYRFYAPDLAHPSQMAGDYVWEKFRQTYVDERGAAALREGETIVKRIRHRQERRDAQNVIFQQETASLKALFLARHPGMRPLAEDE